MDSLVNRITWKVYPPGWLGMYEIAVSIKGIKYRQHLIIPRMLLRTSKQDLFEQLVEMQKEFLSVITGERQ